MVPLQPSVSTLWTGRYLVNPSLLGVCFLVFAFVQLPVYFRVRSCLAEISEG